MSTPDDRKSLQVSPAVHEAVHNLATRLGTSADGALRHLFDPYTVRVQAAPAQYTRWTAAADTLGVSLPVWIAQQVEAAAATQETINQIFYRVDLLCQRAGVKEAKPRRPLKGQ